jgi:citronellol/citronellal dehydrogenase
VPGDTRDEDSIEAAMARIKDHYGRLDVLVNNAGGQYIAAARGHCQVVFSRLQRC